MIWIRRAGEVTCVLLTVAPVTAFYTAWLGGRAWELELVSHFAVQALAVSAIGFAGLWWMGSERSAQPASLAVLALVLPVARWHVGPSISIDRLPVSPLAGAAGKFASWTMSVQSPTSSTGDTSRVAWVGTSGAGPAAAMVEAALSNGHEDGPLHNELNIRVLTVNVHAHNPGSQAFLDLVDAERPDMVVISEMASHWSNAAARLRLDLPHAMGQLDPEPHGSAIFSRYPLHEPEWLDLGVGRPGYRCQLGLDAARLEIIALHLDPPVPESAFDRRNDQIDALVRQTRDLRPDYRIVVGDLNMSMWSPYYRDLASSLSVRNARAGFGVLATWPTFEPPQLRVPIDHVLLSEGLTVTDVRLGPDVGSDHLPLIVDITLPRGRSMSDSSVGRGIFRSQSGGPPAP